MLVLRVSWCIHVFLFDTQEFAVQRRWYNKYSHKAIFSNNNSQGSCSGTGFWKPHSLHEERLILSLCSLGQVRMITCTCLKCFLSIAQLLRSLAEDKETKSGPLNLAAVSVFLHKSYFKLIQLYRSSTNSLKTTHTHRMIRGSDSGLSSLNGLESPSVLKSLACWICNSCVNSNAINI